jgi:hypothetical protein
MKHGTIRAYDALTHTATVQYTESLGQHVAGVPVNQGIAAADVVAGRQCVVVEFDPTHPADAVILAVYP